MPIAEYSLPEDFEEIARPFRALLAGEHDSFRQEHRLLDCHGDVVWVDSALSLLPSTSGRRELAIVMAQDITRRRLAEEHVRETQKIEAAGELAAGVAHDFNNLLMGISGYATLARKQVDAGSRLAEYLSHIEGCVERAASLTQQLLAFGRKEALQLVDLDLNQLIGDAASMLRALLGPQVVVELALEPELWNVSGDPVQLQRVLLNLTLNARDSMPDGGTLTVCTANGDACVVLKVSDTGCGMSPEVQARMFEPFFTTKEHGQGTGLGLSSVHGIVLQSGGDIAVDSAVGDGTTFTIMLPAATSRSILAPAPVAVVERKDGGRARVLVVEDQAPVRNLITELLELHNYDVVAASDAETALSLVDEHQPFDVMLTDIVLPGMDGVALADALYAQDTNTRVLFMSGYPRGTASTPACCWPSRSASTNYSRDSTPCRPPDERDRGRGLVTEPRRVIHPSQLDASACFARARRPYADRLLGSSPSEPRRWPARWLPRGRQLERSCPRYEPADGTTVWPPYTACSSPLRPRRRDAQKTHNRLWRPREERSNRPKRR